MCQGGTRGAHSGFRASGAARWGLGRAKQATRGSFWHHEVGMGAHDDRSPR
jgi:hypothetical protein